MDLSGWDLRFAFPSQNYLRFVQQFLLYPGPRDLIDPFSIDVRPFQPGKYIHRPEVEKELTHPVTRVIMGKFGAGKTSLLNIFLEAGAPGEFVRHEEPQQNLAPHTQRLVVSLPLAEIQPTAPEEDVDQGKCSLLTTTQLIRNIYNTFWKKLFLDDATRSLFYPQLRQSRWWTERLHWFYHHYKPYTTDIPGQFELMAWLETQPSNNLFSPDIPTIEILRNLVDFILSRGPHQEGFWKNTPLPPFDGIQILVDDLEILSPNALKRLIRDAQTLYEYKIDSLWFTLFADDVLEGKLMELGSVTQGKVGFYRLPKWSPEQLQQLITRRLGFPDNMDVNIGASIPGLEDPARRGFVKLMIGEAVKLSSEKNATVDAPIHLLRLLRGSLSITADHYYNKQAKLIQYTDLKEIIKLYKEG